MKNWKLKSLDKSQKNNNYITSERGVETTKILYKINK